MSKTLKSLTQAATGITLLLALAAAAAAQSLPPGSPVLLTEGTGQSTRAVAFEAVTFRSDPFPVVSPVNWNADKSNARDQQTRVMLFATGLSLLAGEGANALTADAQDASGRVYPLKVEALSKPKYVQLLPAPGDPERQVQTVPVGETDVDIPPHGEVVIPFDIPFSALEPGAYSVAAEILVDGAVRAAGPEQGYKRFTVPR